MMDQARCELSMHGEPGEGLASPACGLGQGFMEEEAFEWPWVVSEKRWARVPI